MTISFLRRNTTGPAYTDASGSVDLAADSGLTAHLGDTSDAHDASAVSVADAGNNYTGTDVEAVLAELAGMVGGSGITDPGGSNDDILQRKSGAWTNRTVAQLLVDLAAAGTTFQPLDSDLTAIAALSPSNDDIVQRKSGAWTNRTIAQLKTDLGIPGSLGGVEWTTVTKANTTSRNSTTTVSADPELVTGTLTSGGLYEGQLYIAYDSPSGGGTPDLKSAFAEDATTRGLIWVSWFNASDTGQNSQAACATGQTWNAGTATTARSFFAWFVYWGNGAAASYQWAQATSSASPNDTRVLAGSQLRYRRIV